MSFGACDLWSLLHAEPGKMQNTLASVSTSRDGRLNRPLGLLTHFLQNEVNHVTLVQPI